MEIASIDEECAAADEGLARMNGELSGQFFNKQAVRKGRNSLFTQPACYQEVRFKRYVSDTYH